MIAYEPYSERARANPYPAYRELREQAPVYWTEQADAWVISRYDDVHAILTQPDLFSSDAMGAALTGQRNVAPTGMRAVILFLVHREDCTKFAPAADIDPVFAETLTAACKQGVEALIYRAKIDPPLVALDVRLPFDGSKL